jgi:hypothetical protein
LGKAKDMERPELSASIATTDAGNKVSKRKTISTETGCAALPAADAPAARTTAGTKAW